MEAREGGRKVNWGKLVIIYTQHNTREGPTSRTCVVRRNSLVKHPHKSKTKTLPCSPFCPVYAMKSNNAAVVCRIALSMYNRPRPVYYEGYINNHRHHPVVPAKEA